ncbi:endo-1,3-alpha-glucanase family glycosylhydrolase [Streptomyces beihaiensis]|uniref:Endo-1,3-alpha-glucanase family glycosylhydrolase n=1 Tax=Streptomyces beihaiensis TaxID=2984495 RepID=A0ABT3TNB6_9ACTN|nr:endo-1,3-alpha-glucanase family glycosylhydrolase [Streptomyces beihaiensis]MCX3058487.1 endo-1,3-alpha-glucanase family glycosylhydrolase [Streptomyces beihaiensis]
MTDRHMTDHHPEHATRHGRRQGHPRRLALAAVLGLLLLGLLAGAGLASVAGTGGDDGTPQGERPADSTALPFDLPPAKELRAGPHLVFAHYFPPFPLSLDNRPAAQDYYTRNYLDPQGENGKHAAYGGLLRDRPQPRPPRGGDWRLADLEQEVRTARDAGLDGFTVDILSLTGTNRQRVDLLLRAAHLVDPHFRIVLMPDMTALHTDPRTLADALALLAAHPAAHRLADGRLVVSPFKAEAQDPAWWRRVMARLAEHGIRTALVPVFLDFRSNAQRFAPISHAFSSWGNRSYTGQDGVPGDIRLAHRLGKKWMQPVSVQDTRPDQSVYDEAGNTATLRSTWNHAISDGADWVQLTTWNDYSEGSQFAPSLHNGHTYLDLSSYYLTRFKTGHWPPIVRDTVYVTSRVQYARTADAPLQPLLMSPRQGTATPRDDVEVLTFLTAPADVTAEVGTDTHTYRAPRGVHAELLPLRPGHTRAVVRRAGHTVAAVTTRYPVRTDVTVQDLQYYAVSSGRDGH